MKADASIRHQEVYPLERNVLSKIKTIVVHDSCPDGMASAVLLHDAIPDARVVFAQHGSDDYSGMQAEPGMLFCDLVPPPERASEFLQAGAVVLDHHVKVKNVVEKFGPRGRFGDGVSGALLAFQYVWNPLRGGTTDNQTSKNARQFAELASVRDCWEREDPRWTQACSQASALMFYDTTDWLDWQEPFLPSCQAKMAEMLRVGAISHANKLRGVTRSVDGAYWTRTGRGHQVVIINGGSISDVADAIGERADVVMSFNYAVEDGKLSIRVSIRSHRKVDVGSVAVRFGGGGHQKAAGFRLVVDGLNTDPYKLLVSKLEEADL